MTVKTVAHLNFRGDAHAALTFYQSIFGGELTVVSYADAGNVENPAEADQVIWGQVTAESGFAIMAFDVPATRAWNPGEIPFFVSVRGDEADEVTRYWEKLSDGATIEQPLGPSFWTPLYGMLRDRFGITWIVDLQPAQGPS